MSGNEAERNRSLLVGWVLKCVRLKSGSESHSHSKESDAWAEKTVKTVRRATRPGAKFYPNKLPLHVCAEKDVDCCAAVLLYHGWLVDERNDYTRETALHVACKHDKWRVAKLLLDNGADPNARNWLSRTSLITAIAWKSHKCLDVLLADERVQVAVKNSLARFHQRRVNPFHYAALEGNGTAIRKMIACCSLEELFHEGNESNAPLIFAAISASPDILQAMLGHLTERNRLYLVNRCVSDYFYETPLMALGRSRWWTTHEIEARKIDCLNAMLKCGADANVVCGRRRRGYPALYYSICSEQSNEYCGILVKHTDLETMEVRVRDAILRKTVVRGRAVVMKALCEKYGDLVRAESFTLVIRAVLSPFLKVKMIQLLLEAGIDVVRRNVVENELFAKCILRAPFDPVETFLTVLVPAETFLAVLDMLLKAGAAENVNILLRVFCNCDYYQCEGFANSIAKLMQKYATVKHYNSIIPIVCGTGFALPVISLKHSCRLAIRGALMCSGLYPSMCRVDVTKLRLPPSLEDYVAYKL